LVGEEKKKLLISNYKEVFPLEGRTILLSEGKGYFGGWKDPGIQVQ